MENLQVMVGNLDPNRLLEDIRVMQDHIARIAVGRDLACPSPPRCRSGPFPEKPLNRLEMWASPDDPSADIPPPRSNCAFDAVRRP